MDHIYGSVKKFGFFKVKLDCVCLNYLIGRLESTLINLYNAQKIQYT